ncbi:hypothetical protein Ami103574_03245 [Aminipila butyrica]|uniref:Flagellar hook-associated protein 1 n=1 Tax=Aminipila butyrica TaxID=433296 RepID=A0A858C0C6_9FIRM|nr:flagellar basal body protein [Aminipila butyrica]QIB70670.1 hypothetical protein Ami103574_03245 [Aminipila butyrica]
MLRSTFYSFTTALRGMTTAQKQLDVTGQNISNVSTTGYTRQRADVYSAAAAGSADQYSTRTSTQVGQGSVVGSISQIRDSFLDVRFRREAANLGEQEAKLDTLKDLSMVFDEIENGGLMDSFSKFVTQLQAFASNANSSEFDSIVRDAASTLVKQFNQYASQISIVREEKEYNLKEVTEKTLNDLMGNIAELNKSIREVQSGGGQALELKDERNLLLDQLAEYMKIDVKYSPKEMAGGIVVDDVTISMVGEDGSKQPLIHNDSASSFTVKTQGDDGLDKATVTIDNSAIAAKQMVTDINNLLKAMSTANAGLQNINSELAKSYPSDPDADPAGSALDYTRLAEKLTTIAESITGSGGYDEQIETAKTAVSDAQTAVNNALKADPKPSEDDMKALYKTLNDAVSNRATLINARTAALKEQETLEKYQSKSAKYAASAVSCDAKIKSELAAYGITATQMYTPGDFTTCYYTFTDADGNPVTDKNGNAVKWNAGATSTTVDRSKLESIGISFESTFDAEELASPGALKGALEMLNSEGVFDYEANEVRGIGYYEKMLDSLANQLATTLNKLNDNPKTTGVVEDLFQTSDGASVFTAENLRISDGWKNGKYGITPSKTTQVGSGSNSGQSDNILLMISTISTKMTYSTGPVANKDVNGNYLKTAADGTTSIGANGRDGNGNYTLDGALVANKDMVNYKSINLTKIDDNNYTDGTNTYTKTADNVFTYTDGTNTTAVNSDGIIYKGDGSTGQYQLDAQTLSPSTTTTGEYVGPDGTTVVANGQDDDGNYTMTTTDADGKKTVVTVANADGVMYKTNPDGSIAKDKEGKPILDAAESKLDYRSESFLYNGTFQEYLANVSNVVSLDISSISNMAANHETILGEIQTSRDAISSVSLDEEGVNIMQYQKAYNASARLMTALDECLERIINQMGKAGL